MGLSCNMHDLRCSMQDLSLQRGLFVAVLRLLSSCGTRASEHGGSVVEARGLSCPMACGILFPWPGIKPKSPALEGGFLTTGSPGKSCYVLFNVSMLFHVVDVPWFVKPVPFWWTFRLFPVFCCFKQGCSLCVSRESSLEVCCSLIPLRNRPEGSGVLKKCSGKRARSALVRPFLDMRARAMTDE